LIQGGSGTGKELVAQAMHRLSNCSTGPFVAVHCAALSPSLLESELFGHEKGAFTGAVGQRKGRFEMANNGTLFLDEISEIDLATQVKLLRVLETRQFERVGGTDSINVNIRVIAATNRDLRKYVEEGKFREDLYYRLNVIEIKLPSLKERASDIPILCDHFIREFSERNQRKITGISQSAVSALQAYDWPGNVRELRNTIEKMVVLARGEILEADDVPENIRNALLLKGIALSAMGGMPQTQLVEDESLRDMEKRKILDALNAAGGNKSKAAEALGISRRTLHRKLNEWSS
jgi:transcriptional regulator with PAS, ATPase and Fis domain